MTRFYLRYRLFPYPLPAGTFTIGRSPDCNLFIDDALVSRKHITLTVEKEHVSLHDEGSRNGTIVNGVEIDEATLTHEDRVYIGTHEIVFFDSAAESKFNNDASEEETLGILRQTMSAKKYKDEQTRQASTAEVVSIIASKALVMGRHEDAEKMLLPVLDAFMLQLKLSPPTDEDRALAIELSDLCAAMVSAGASTRWIDWVIDVHVALRLVMDASLIDRLHDLVRRRHYTQTAPIQSYLKVLQEMSEELNAADAFRVSRVQGLAKVIDSQAAPEIQKT